MKSVPIKQMLAVQRKPDEEPEIHFVVPGVKSTFNLNNVIAKIANRVRPNVAATFGDLMKGVETAVRSTFRAHDSRILEHEKLCLAHTKADRAMRAAYRRRDAAQDELRRATDSYHEADKVRCAAWREYGQGLYAFLELGGTVFAVIDDGTETKQEVPVTLGRPKGATDSDEEAADLWLVDFKLKNPTREVAALESAFFSARARLYGSTLEAYETAKQALENAKAAVKTAKERANRAYKACQDHEVSTKESYISRAE